MTMAAHPATNDVTAAVIRQAARTAFAFASYRSTTIACENFQFPIAQKTDEKAMYAPSVPYAAGGYNLERTGAARTGNAMDTRLPLASVTTLRMKADLLSVDSFVQAAPRGGGRRNAVRSVLIRSKEPAARAPENVHASHDFAATRATTCLPQFRHRTDSIQSGASRFPVRKFASMRTKGTRL